MSGPPHLAGRWLHTWQTRGCHGLFRFMLAHLARTQSDMVFELNLLRRSDRQFFDKNRKIIVIERHNLHNHNLKGIVGQLLAGEASIYRSGLERNDLAFVVIDEKKRLLQRAFVQFETRYQTLLGETAAIPVLTPCRTIPAMRRERLCPKTVRFAGAFLAKRGHRRLVIACDEHNKGSVQAILQDGFELNRAIRSVVLLARFAVQKVTVQQAIHWRMVFL